MAEIVYMRCSTRPQATGDSLRRQLDDCISFARDRGLVIGWVFCDIASGDGPLPQRDAAMALAKRKKCSVLVESIDRWSRSGVDGSEAFAFFMGGRVVQCSLTARESEDRILCMVRRVMNGR